MMPPHRGTSILQVSCLVLLSIVEAFKLSSLPTTFPGDSLAISWSVSEEDPQDFDLGVGFCEGLEDTTLLFSQPGIDARASTSRRASVPKTLPDGLEPPASCFIKAVDSDTGQLLDSIPVKLVASAISTSAIAALTQPTPERTITTRIPTTSRPKTHAPPSTTSSSDITTLTKHVSTRSLPPIKSPSLSSTLTSSSLSTVHTPSSTALSNSLSSSVESEPTHSTTPETVSLTASESTSGSTTNSSATSQADATHSSASSDNAKRPIGPLLGEALGGAFAFLLLLSILITFYVWRRRRRRRERVVKPFLPDTGYLQPITKQEEIENGRLADTSVGDVQSNQEPVVLVTTEKVDPARGDSVGNLTSETGTGTGARAVVATVEEEVTMLRARLVALEDQHRELTGELRSAEFIPPMYSR